MVLIRFRTGFDHTAPDTESEGQKFDSHGLEPDILRLLFGETEAVPLSAGEGAVVLKL